MTGLPLTLVDSLTVAADALSMTLAGAVMVSTVVAETWQISIKSASSCDRRGALMDEAIADAFTTDVKCLHDERSSRNRTGNGSRWAGCLTCPMVGLMDLTPLVGRQRRYAARRTCKRLQRNS